ncbi:hypothetical protein HAX54_030608 [Datura stramonium]|uniref:Uncharacterized protein n=1 Tax=Datura stramonium TaxID=4076 RepID=A0ABS8SB81_DATST|nr:hypothetical protein [Datura stramonium]
MWELGKFVSIDLGHCALDDDKMSLLIKFKPFLNYHFAAVHNWRAMVSIRRRKLLGLCSGSKRLLGSTAKVF